MKPDKFLLFGLFVSIYVGLALFSSCVDTDMDIENEFGPHKEVLVIASEIVLKNEGNAYWVKRNGSNTWEMMHTEITNFNHESGYEYVVEVYVDKIDDPGPDQSSRCYTLIKIISKEKKNSEVLRFQFDQNHSYRN